MWRFVLRTCLFLSLPVVWGAFCYAINRWLISQNRTVIQERMLFMGDSQMRNAVAPRFFRDARNVSQVAEPMVMTRMKLERFLAESERDTIVVGVGAQTLSRYQELKFEDPAVAPELFDRIYPLAGPSELDGLPVDRQAYFRSIIRNMCLYPSMDHRPYVGSFIAAPVRSFIRNEQEMCLRHFGPEGRMGVSDLMAAQVEQIARLCREQGVVLIWVIMPVTRAYYELVPPEQWDFLFACLERTREQGARVIDLARQEIPEGGFRDADHLNEKGAELFTRALKDTFRKGPVQVRTASGFAQ
ncbi:MAG: hypothetical protein KDB88_09525 [Flavobacteriales bacterium]|nr:hypothetical protein [Flavobacteriales bacterium]